MIKALKEIISKMWFVTILASLLITMLNICIATGAAPLLSMLIGAWLFCTGIFFGGKISKLECLK